MVYHLPVCVLRVSNESCLAVDGLFYSQAEIPDRPICWLLQPFEPSVDPEVFHAVVCLQPSARWVQDWPCLWITQHVIGHRREPICPVFVNTAAQVWPKPLLRCDSFSCCFFFLFCALYLRTGFLLTQGHCGTFLPLSCFLDPGMPRKICFYSESYHGKQLSAVSFQSPTGSSIFKVITPDNEWRQQGRGGNKVQISNYEAAVFQIICTSHEMSWFDELLDHRGAAVRFMSALILTLLRLVLQTSPQFPSISSLPRRPVNPHLLLCLSVALIHWVGRKSRERKKKSERSLFGATVAENKHGWINSVSKLALWGSF